MISQKNEVTGFGSGENGDDDDNWEVQCERVKEGEMLLGSISFNLRHQKNKSYLGTRSNYQYTYNNCGRQCPILGQLEVSGSPYPNQYTNWRIRSVFSFLF